MREGVDRTKRLFESLIYCLMCVIIVLMLIAAAVWLAGMICILLGG